jgi:hypothetical protein
MSVEELRIDVIRGDAIRVNAVIKDFPLPGDKTGALVDPDSHVIQLLKPDGSQQGSNYTSPTKRDTGRFYQNIVIPSGGVAGEWKVSWAATLSALTSTKRVSFKVIE